MRAVAAFRLLTKRGKIMTKIEELNLSPRDYNALKREGIDTVEQILALKPNQLLCIRGVGVKSMYEILDKVCSAS